MTLIQIRVAYCVLRQLTLERRPALDATRNTQNVFA
jgi:hypothetical protein